MTACPSVQSRPAVAKALPDISLPCLGKGPDTRLADLRGPLVINVWAQWCGPCREEAPYLAELHRKAGDKVKLLGIDYIDTRPDLAVKFAIEQHWDYPHLADREKQLQQPLKIGGPPLTIFVDKDGAVVHVQRKPITSQHEPRSAGEGQTGGRPVRTGTTYDIDLPDFLHRLRTASKEVDPDELSRFLPPEDDSRVRDAAVLILLAGGNVAQGNGPDVLLTERAWTLRRHAGQMSFPGGSVDPEDGTGADGLIRTALREAEEETGVDPTGVEVFAVWPSLWVPVSNFAVSPVLGWWREPSPVAVVDPAEVASVHRVSIEALTDPANRISCRHPSGFTGPAFTVGDLYIWGFTAGLLDKLLKLGGWARDWDPTHVVPLPDRLVDAAWRSEGRQSEDVRRLTAIEHDLGRPEGVE